MNAVFFIPPPPRRVECIRVDGRLYCERGEPPPPREIGLVILLFCLAAGYFSLLLYWHAVKDYNGFYVWGLGLFAPIIVFALWLMS